ncbi:MAG TPA: hypothetical protein VFX92_04565 [Candidatus Krumholzibacteria bacterium]|nr:hypothetical protein [Candidatus Krumholzibacteria bacterium]
MLNRISIRMAIVRAALLAALLAALAVGCGDSNDSPTGGGGGGGSTLSLAAGTYQVQGAFFNCGETTPRETATDSLVACKTQLVDEFFAVNCPVKRNGNQLSVVCTDTREVYTGCSETVKVDVHGTVTGDVYELAGTIERSDNPADCWDGASCDSIHVVLTRVGGAPSGCTYADAGTLDLTIVGGPRAGRHTLDAYGSGNDSGGLIAFNFYANEGTGVPIATSPASPATGVSSLSLYATTDYINPATLPATLPVTVTPPGANTNATAGGPAVYLSYTEYGETAQYFAESVVSGSFVVHEISVDHLAGTLNVVVSGTQYNNGTPTPGQQRTLSGGYFVTGGTLTQAPGSNIIAQTVNRLMAFPGR